MFDRFSSYDPNVKLVKEVDPNKFLDTKLTNINGTYKFNVYLKKAKLSSRWTSKTPKRYKRNKINGDLHRSKRIPLYFDEETSLKKETFMKANYQLRFINNAANEFQKCKECGDESFIIPTGLFELAKPFIFVEIPCEHFWRKFRKFTMKSFRMVITWKTRNMRSLFPVKDKNDYKPCVI